jgi:recombination DNA repair RAD52 pathway protein
MLNEQQYQQLLKPLNPSRVAKRSQAGRNLSYLEAWDVKAHLIRIFGFGGWSWDVLVAELAFEQEKDGKWNVGYKVVGRLTIGNDYKPTYTEAAVGTATLPQRGEAHDMAVKTAESDALKRAAINLGTQFGLSLYDNGSTKDVIGRTLDRDTVSQEEGEPGLPVTDTSETVPDSEGAEAWIGQMKTAIDNGDVSALLEIKKAMTKDKVAENVYQGVTLAKWLDKAIAAVGKGK